MLLTRFCVRGALRCLVFVLALPFVAAEARAELHTFEGRSAESPPYDARPSSDKGRRVFGGLLDGFRFRIGTQPFTEAADDDDDLGFFRIQYPPMLTYFGGGDRYRLRVTLHDPPELFTNPGIVHGRWDVRAWPCDRECTAGLAMRAGDVFVLRGFSLGWVGNHEVKRISVRERNGLLTIGMENRPTFWGLWETSPENFGG